VGLQSFPDGRPDELVRGVDIVGTPLAAADQDCCQGDTPEVIQRLLWRGIRVRFCGRRFARDFDFGVGSGRKKRVPRTGRRFLPPRAHDVIKTGGSCEARRGVAD